MNLNRGLRSSTGIHRKAVKKECLLRNVVTKNFKEYARQESALLPPRRTEVATAVAISAKSSRPTNLGRRRPGTASATSKGPGTAEIAIKPTTVASAGPPPPATTVVQVHLKPPVSRGGSTIQQSYELYTTSLRNQINKFFGIPKGAPSDLPPIRPQSDCYDPMHITVQPYTLEIFIQELEKETTHYRITTSKELESQLGKRSSVAAWIRNTAETLRLHSQTQHTAMYITDAYLRVQTVTIYCLEVFAAAVLFIAAKQEETDCFLSTSDLLKYCKSDTASSRRIAMMESKVLTKLQFRTSCPSSLFFMRACSSQLVYCDVYAKSFTEELAQKLLNDSLWEVEMIFAANSRKGRLAIYYAVKYVAYNYDLLRAACGRDKNIWNKFSTKCFPEYRAAVLSGVVLPKRVTILPPLKPACALKDLTNKGRGGVSSSSREPSPAVIVPQRPRVRVK